MTGFGRFIAGKAVKGSGVSVIKMAGKTQAQSADELARELERLYRLPQGKLDAEKKSAYRMMKNVDWGVLVKNYYKAYALAMDRNGKAGADAGGK
jgi:hypothetical protein